MSTETKAAVHSSTLTDDRTAKKQKTGDVQDQIMSEFNLIPLTKKKKKADAQVWNKYASYRRAMKSRMEENTKSGDRDDTGGSDEDDELICNDPNLHAWRNLKSHLDSFHCDGMDGADSNLTDQWKQCLHFSVSDASYEDEDSLRGVDVTTTFFSPHATPRAIRLSMSFYLRPRSSWLEHHHNIHVQLLSFNTEKKDPKVQTLATYQTDPQRINVKNLNEKKVTQICKHLEIDSENTTFRYILMKMLLFSSDWVDSCGVGGYALNSRKLESATDDTADKKDARRRYGWLEYNVRIASKKLGPYHDCYEYEVQEEENDTDGSEGYSMFGLF